MRHVILGAGPAGVIAAETLRKADANAEIIVIGDEPEPPYSRMAIPYFLIDKVPESGTHLRKTEGHFDKLGITVRRGERATKLDPQAKLVTLSSGATQAYDKLLIATGSRPLAPPIPGMDSANVHSCWTLEDARNIHRLAKPGANVLLMGAGFIGCIILEALALSGANLTVVEMGDRMVPRMLDQTAGNLVKRWCETKNVTVHTSTRVNAIEASGTGLVARLDNGTDVDADLIVSATGVTPNIEFLEGTGIATNFGVMVDANLQSNVADIYAAGDVAEGLDFSTGEHAVQAIQPTAVEHGRAAALNMLGHNAPHRGSLNMNVLDTLGLVSSSFGLWMGVAGGDTTSLVDEQSFRYIQLQFDGDVLVGGQALGLTQHVGVLRGLIQTRAPLGAWKEKLMHEPLLLPEAYLACAQDTARVGQIG
jgi:NAD(P)H-nitrite reductase large subunit